ncbi:MAG TPA: septum site-determining protein MinC, partial [Polyangia bacterium]|nr:septum site-determining protein MinC [Polyangia bacterium]
RCGRDNRRPPMSDTQTEEADDDVPCAPLFDTETMAELSARQGRLPDAVAIYRHLVREAEAGKGSDADRLARWRARLSELEGAPGNAPAPAPSPAGAPAASPSRAPAAPLAPSLAALPRHRPSLVIREPVRSGQVVYADGRDLIVLASVNPGAQLLADGNIHVYGALRGRAVAGAQGHRDAQVFCLALDPELVGVDAGYLLSDDIPAPLRGGAARVYLTDAGTCAVVPLAPAQRSSIR